MRRILILVLMCVLLFAGCGEAEPEVIEEVVENTTQVVVEEEEEVSEAKLEEMFNSNLEDYEEEWLNYLEEKYPDTKLYHIKSKTFSYCDNCYDLYYKKDFSMIKLKIKNSTIEQESTIVNDLAVEIDGPDVCESLYGGEWNECPSICNTDEVACATVCGEPVCQFDYNTIVFKQIGEVCGGLDEGNCDYGLSCVYTNQDDEYGTCK